MTLTIDIVSKHNTIADCWVIINGKVYDITTFIDKHPGGASSLVKYAGKDISTVFNKVHSATALKRITKHYIDSISS